MSPQILAQYFFSGLSYGSIYAVVALGFNIVYNATGIINFAQGEFVMLGMYGAYAAHLGMGIDPYLSPIVVVPGLFVFGALVYRLILQPLQSQPMMQVFATFGLLMVIENSVLAVTRGITQSVNSVLTGVSIDVGPVSIGLSRLLVLAAATIMTVGIGWFLKSSLSGKGIRAVAQDRKAARLMGINVERVYMITFGIGAALAGLAGCLLAPLYTMSPQIGMNFIMPAFAVVVLGGLGSVTGAYVGGFIVGLTDAFAGFYLDPALKQAVIFLVFIAVLVVRPSGLFGVAGAEEVGLRDQS